MVEQFGLDVVQAYMRHVQDNAEESVRRVITRLNNGAVRVHAGQRRRDPGQRVGVDRGRREATIDFTGTSAQLPNNFNAPSAVCVAAVLYVFRTLVDDAIPLNAGCLKPLKLIIPAGLDAEPGAIRPRWSPATSRRRRASPTRSTARSESWPPRRAR